MQDGKIQVDRHDNLDNMNMTEYDTMCRNKTETLGHIEFDILQQIMQYLHPTFKFCSLYQCTEDADN